MNRSLSRLANSLEPLEQRIAPAAFVVTTTADAGAGSLRAAIAGAEADAAPDIITFNVPGPGVHTIQLASALPQITHPVTIDGTSEPGYAGQPVIELDGELTHGTSANGLWITSGDVTVKGLTINRFDGNGIFVPSGPGNITIQGCFIGTDATGSIARANGGHGILLEVPNSHIGGHKAAERNVISGNLQGGIDLGSYSTVVQGNYIGTNLLASLQIPNLSSGISLGGGGNHVIGGSAPGEGNVISGNSGDDVQIYNSNGNTVSGNIIGLDLALQVELQSKAHGISIGGNSSFNVIGGTSAGARNVIAAHDEPGAIGLLIDGLGSGNTVLGNLIGTNPDGDDELQNNVGIYVTAAGTVIGDLAGHGNLIAGNKGYGIDAEGADNLQVLGNRLGIYHALGDVTLGNGASGLNLYVGTGAVVKGNVIGGNNAHGIILNQTVNTTVQGNLIGTDSTGLLPRANGGDGVLVVNCTGLLIGGSGAGEGNVISGNGVYGIDLNSNQPVKVFGNHLGVDAAGTGAIPDGDSGIRVVGGSGHQIGGAGAGEGNVISGSLRGVQLATSGNFVRGNIIGLNQTATNKVYTPNTDPGGAGVYIYAGANNVIGGTQPSEGNIIAGNAGTGVLVNGNGTGNQILGNLIGTNAAGDAFLGNGGINPGVHSIVVTAPGTIIGGPGAARNVIDSGSGRAINVSGAANVLIQGNWIGLAPDGVTKLGNLAGIGLSGAGAVNATIQDNVISGCAAWAIAATDNGGHVLKGNRLGTNAAGTAIVANGQQGITFTRESNVIIGGPKAGDGNLIAGSGIDAILLSGGTNISITGNRIGTDLAGVFALPNQEGININAIAANPVSGVTVAGNLIAGTKGSGINLSGAQTGTVIQSNQLGLAANGVDALPNGQGISIGNGSGILIGGTAAQANTVAFSKQYGIGAYYAGTGDVQIAHNTLRENTAGGLLLSGTSGTLTVDGNTVQGNAGQGVRLDGAQHVTLTGNLIATNGGPGVLVQNSAQTNTIGGPAAGAGNTITDNDGPGVFLQGGSGTLVSRNAIFGNSGLAIDLGAVGVNPNDAGDADDGANHLQNSPVLTGLALLPNGHTMLLGSLESTPGRSFRIEAFAESAAGQHFVQEVTASTDANGHAVFQVDLGPLAAGEQVIATATDVVSAETSELAEPTVAPAVPVLTVSNATVTEGNTGTVNAVFTVTLSQVPTLPVSFDYSTLGGTATAGQDFTAISGTFTFPAGATTLTTTLSVPVTGDLTPELAEHFTLHLAQAKNAFLLQADGDGTIANDDTSLVIDHGGRQAHWRDLDGDLVTLRSSKPILSPDDFVMLTDGQGGEQFAALLLADDGAAAAKTSLVLTAQRVPHLGTGDGRASLGYLDATGVDLGIVSISGDLGHITAGDANPATVAVKSLRAGSMGYFGLGTQTPGGNLHSEIAGSLGGLVLRGDFTGGSLHAIGSIGRVTIVGNLTGDAADHSGSVVAERNVGAVYVGGSLTAGTGVNSGEIAAGANLGRVRLGGDLHGVLSAGGNLAGVQIGGSAVSAHILAGFSPAGAPVNPDAAIGPVSVTDNWIASDLVAGIDPGADGFFGSGGDDVAATALAPHHNDPALFSRIAGIHIGGYIAGTTGNPADHFAFAAQQIGRLSVGSLRYVLNSHGIDNLVLGKTGDVTLTEVA